MLTKVTKRKEQDVSPDRLLELFRLEMTDGLPETLTAAERDALDRFRTERRALGSGGLDVPFDL